MERIVVGVDGSEGSRRALRWAADEAALRGARLEVIYVYEHTPPWFAYAYHEGMTPAQVDAAQRDAERRAREATEHAQAFADSLVADLHDVAVKAIAVESRRPADVLIARSSGADLLVVGSRGHGGFAGLLLGSVSQQCATHAACPVVIIRPGATAS